MSGTRGSATRWILAGLIAAAAAAAILLVADGEEANGGPEATAAAKWSSLQSSPLVRTEVGAARIDSFIYVAGGFLAPNGDTTEKVARYDIATDRWELVDPMPIAVNHPAVASIGGRLYVHGGYRADGALADETDALQRYDPASGTWATLAPSGFPRAAHALVAGQRGLLYAIGGAHRGGDPLRLVQVYDPAIDQWFGGPPMPTAREHIGGTRVKARIYVLGGRSGGTNLRVVQALDLDRDRWLRRRPLRLSRSGFQAVTVRGRIVVAGGEELAEGDDTIASVELYDPKDGSSRRLPKMLTPRHGLGVVAKGRRIFALEGGPQPGLAFSSALEALRVSGKR